MTPSPTKTSIVIRFLIKVCFLPITLEENKQRIGFRLISWRSLAYVIIYIGLGTFLLFSPGLLLLLLPAEGRKLMNSTTHEEKFTQFRAGNVLEKFTPYFNQLTHISFIFPLILAKGLNNINTKIVWNERLPFPKHGIKSIISYFGSITGTLISMITFFLQYDVPPQNCAISLIVTLSGKISKITLLDRRWLKKLLSLVACRNF